MTNDLSTLSGALLEMKDQLIYELGQKGVTATYSSTTGLLGLVSKIGDIQTGGTSCPKLVMGTFTTSSTRTTKENHTLNYNGNGYPIACMVFIQNGAYNNTSGGDTTWYASVNRYDVGAYYMTKSEINTTPTYTTSGTNNYGFIGLIYKNSTSDPATFTSTYAKAAVTYNSGNAGTSTACVRFVGNGKTLGTYVGNKTSSTIGLAPSTTYSYIVIYSE